MSKEVVKLLGEIGALPMSFVGDRCQYASIPSWMMKDHESTGSTCLHFAPKHDSQRKALAQPEFQEALDLIMRGFSLLATAKERAIARIVREQCAIEHDMTVDREVAPVQARNAELRDATESLLGAIQGGDLENAKKKAYAALAPREDA